VLRAADLIVGTQERSHRSGHFCVPAAHFYVRAARSYVGDAKVVDDLKAKPRVQPAYAPVVEHFSRRIGEAAAAKKP